MQFNRAIILCSLFLSGAMDRGSLRAEARNLVDTSGNVSNTPHSDRLKLGKPNRRALTGGFLGSMLSHRFAGGYRGATDGYSKADPYGKDGIMGTPIGVFDIAVLAVMIGWLLAQVRKRKRETELIRTPYPAQSPSLRVVTPPLDSLGEQLQRYTDEWIEAFMSVQSAWSLQNLKQVRTLISPEVGSTLEKALEKIAADGRQNRIESIVVRSTDAVDFWEEDQTDRVTIHFQGSLLDYNIDTKTGEVVDGNAEDPEEFDEFWTFARNNTKEGAESASWIVTSIQRGEHGGGRIPRMAALY